MIGLRAQLFFRGPDLPTRIAASARNRSGQGTAALVRLLLRWLLALSLGLGSMAASAEPPDAQAILTAADQSRGTGLPGVVMLVRVSSEEAPGQPDPDADVTLKVKSHDGSTLAEVIEPLRSKGMRLLLVRHKMWLHKPGMKKPVAVSARQRLAGEAALGDIASTEYARDYDATYLRNEDLAGEPCHVLELRAAQPNTTYARINYWVSERSGLGLRADFLSLSGKLLKRADFQYQTTLEYQDRSTTRFISRMKISDALTSRQTTLEYSEVRVQAIALSDFDVGALQ